MSSSPQQHEQPQQRPSSRDDATVNSVQHFMRHSRLHFIGQWRSAMDELFAQWFREHPSWHHGTLTQQRLFVHVDMDAFFCSVQLAKPQHAALRDKPVAIAAGRHNSDISSCNYVARAYGVRAGMYVREARARCPGLVILGYDLPACEHVAKTLYRILFESFPRVAHMALQVYSIDEAMIATDTDNFDLLVDYCDVVRRELTRATGGCTASCGIAPNVLLARIATARAKPNGVCVIRHADVPALMRTLPFSKIHGVGHAVLAKVHRLLKTQAQQQEQQQRSGGGGMVGIRHTDNDDNDDAGDTAAMYSDSSSSSSGSNGEDDEDEDASDAHDDDNDDNSILPTPPRHATAAASRQPLPRRFRRRHRRRRSLTCAAVQRLSRAALQHALGQRAGDTFYHLCRGADTRVVVRTGDAQARRAAGKAAVPTAVGCSMNYAVRPTCRDDVWRIAHELLQVVCGKLRRAAASASGLRVTLLERHPMHAVETAKYLGRGFCVEVHVAVKFAHALDAREHATMLQALQHVVSPLLVDARDISDATRAEQLGLLPRDRESGVDGWTVTVPTLRDIVIADLRGMTVQATGLRALDSDDEHKPARKPAAGQLSLAAAFSRATAAQQQQRVVMQHDDDDDVIVMSDKPVQQQQQQQQQQPQCDDVTTIATPPVALPLARHDHVDAHTRAPHTTHDDDADNNDDDGDDNDNDNDKDDLWSLWRMSCCDDSAHGDDGDTTAATARWSQFVQRWQRGCARACAQLDYARVKAYLRCAALRCAEHSARGDAAQSRACFARLHAFAQQRLPAPVAWQ